MSIWLFFPEKKIFLYLIGLPPPLLRVKVHLLSSLKWYLHKCLLCARTFSARLNTYPILKDESCMNEAWIDPLEKLVLWMKQFRLDKNSCNWEGNKTFCMDRELCGYYCNCHNLNSTRTLTAIQLKLGYTWKWCNNNDSNNNSQQ